MALRQDKFTYQVTTEQCLAPQPPLNCGCDNVVLVLNKPDILTNEDRVLVVYTKDIQRILPAERYTDTNGIAKYLWSFVYTFEYDDVNLVDTSRPVRSCDIECSICEDCSIKYINSLLKGYVQTVSGDVVDNTDPQNPVVDFEITGNIVDHPDDDTWQVNFTPSEWVSTDAPNQLEIGSDGNFLVDPTPSIDADNGITLGSDDRPYYEKLGVKRVGWSDSGVLSPTINISAVGTHIISESTVQTLVNPSANLPMFIATNIVGRVGGTLRPGWYGFFRIEISVNGGAYNVSEIGFTNTGAVNYVGGLPVEHSADDFDTQVVAAGSYSLRTRISVRTVTPGTGAGTDNIDGFNHALRLTGFVGHAL
jgi:hypothetical protein